MTYADHKTRIETQRDFCEANFDMHFSAKPCGWTARDGYRANRWAVTLRHTGTGREMTVDYYMGEGHRTASGAPISPEPFAVLSSIYHDDPQDQFFDYWCSEFGYDPDSRRALDTYLACQRQTVAFQRVFPNMDWEQYPEIINY